MSKLPKAASPHPPAFPYGTVRLYRNAEWTSNQNDYLDLSIGDYVSGSFQSILGTKINDATTWIAFNLPLGSVMTLMDNVVAQSSAGVSDLSYCGRTVDLCGTGQLETVDLQKVNMNDCVSAFFWREVDMDLGAIQLYEDLDFKGARSVIFLSEWNSGVPNSIENWYIGGKASSVRWNALNDRQSVVLFENKDGTAGVTRISRRGIK